MVQLELIAAHGGQSRVSGWGTIAVIVYTAESR